MIRRVLSAYSGQATKGSGLRYALRLARASGASVSGVLRHDASYLESTVAKAIPQALRDQLREFDAAQITEISQRFEQIAAEEGFSDGVAFHDLRESPALRIGNIAAYHDVIVMGHHSDALHEHHLSARPDLIAMIGGRPVIIVPNGYDGPVEPVRISVLWEDGRNAMSALRAAVNLFPSSSLTLVTKNASGGDVPGGGVEAFLAAQDRKAEKHIIDPQSERDPAAWRAAFKTCGADMIVGGIDAEFEHSGSFKGRLFSALDVPCLIAN